jgi:hypothetical protein
VFLKLSATADRYMGCRRTCVPLSYHNIPLSRKEHAVAHFSANTRKIKVKFLTYLVNLTFEICDILRLIAVSLETAYGPFRRTRTTV